MILKLIFMPVILLSYVHPVRTASYSEMKALLKNVTNGKDVNIRPVLDNQRPVKVFISFNLIYIQSFDEIDGHLALTGYFGIHWQDETISWNPDENGVYSLTFADDLVWKPCFIISNSYDEVKYIYKDDAVKRIDSQGTVYWYTGDTYDLVCNADVSRYPFDSQTCQIHLIPWGYTAEEVNLFAINEHIDLEYYSPHKTWEIVKTRAIENDDHNFLAFEIEVKRRPMFFVLNLILPIFVMSVLNICVFLLPPDSGERVGYSVTILLAIAVFLTISSDSLPATSTPRLPTISLLLFVDVVLSSFIVVFVIWGLRFYHRDDQLPVSFVMRSFAKVSRFLRCKTCCKKKKDKYVDPWDRERDITWTDVATEWDVLGGTLVSLLIIAVNILYVVDVYFKVTLIGAH